MKRTIIYFIVIILIVLSAKFPRIMLNPGELTEGHQKTKDDCLACHKPFWGIESDRCISCHKIEEIGMNDSSINKEIILFHGKLKNQECVSCHSDHMGIHPKVSISRFDHSMLSSELQLNCSSCHGKPDDKLHEQLSASCGSCHKTDSWKLTGVFNHDMIMGANKTNCIACHQNPTDPFHQSLKESCDKCHTTTKWLPSSFDHSAYFILDKNHNDKCSTCHTNNNYLTYTCYGCHEHSEVKIASEHQKEGIYDFNDCASCHRSGDEHDIKMNSDRSGKINANEVENIKKYIKDHKKEEKKKDKANDKDDD